EDLVIPLEHERPVSHTHGGSCAVDRAILAGEVRPQCWIGCAVRDGRRGVCRQVKQRAERGESGGVAHWLAVPVDQRNRGGVCLWYQRELGVVATEGAVVLHQAHSLVWARAESEAVVAAR